MPPTERGIGGHSGSYAACLLTPTETGFPANSGLAAVKKSSPTLTGRKLRRDGQPARGRDDFRRQRTAFTKENLPQQPACGRWAYGGNRLRGSLSPSMCNTICRLGRSGRHPCTNYRFHAHAGTENQLTSPAFRYSIQSIPVPPNGEGPGWRNSCSTYLSSAAQSCSET